MNPFRSLTDPGSTEADDPVEVFAGTGWEAGMLQSLLENADIEVFIYFGGEATMAPWDSGGGMPLNRLVVARRNAEKAKEVVSQYFDAINHETPSEEIG